MELRKWYKLDNAGKIFPSVSTKKRSNIFRLSVELNDLVDPLILQTALVQTIKRFPTLNVRLRRGAFWYYLEANDNYPRVAEESPYLLQHFEKYRDKYGFMFRVLYYKKRISLEMFHSLTDGTGALEFLRSLIYTYLLLKEVNLPENVNILTEDIEKNLAEAEDSFINNFNARIKSSRKEITALKFKNIKYSHNWLGFIVGYIKLDQLKNIAKKYDATISEYIAATLIKTALSSKELFEDKDRPFSLLIPVNLRRYFSSRSLRNFSLFIHTSQSLNQELSMEDILKKVKEDFCEGLKKDNLLALLTNNVRVERNFFLRIAPRRIKEVILKIGYLMFGDKGHTISFSNLGLISLPQEMDKYINSFTFTPGGGYSSPLNVGIVTYNNTLTISFLTSLTSRVFERNFFRLLSSEGLDIIIDNNDLEV